MPPQELDDVSPEMELPSRFTARIVAQVQFRSGDGPLEELAEGLEVDVEVALASMVLSWVDGGQPLIVTLARPEFLHYVDIGAIHIYT